MAEDFGALAAIKDTLPQPVAPVVRTPKIDARGRSYATGRRKNAVARVWVKPGSGKITVNGRSLESYFPNAVLRMMVHQPLVLADLDGKFYMIISVCGGGPAGQASAIRMGISRALLGYNEQLKSLLRGAGLLTRDPRMKERKKPGRRAARRRFQFSKR